VFLGDGLVFAVAPFFCELVGPFFPGEFFGDGVEGDGPVASLFGDVFPLFVGDLGVGFSDTSIFGEVGAPDRSEVSWEVISSGDLGCLSLLLDVEICSLRRGDS